MPALQYGTNGRTSQGALGGAEFRAAPTTERGATGPGLAQGEAPGEARGYPTVDG